MLTVTYQTIDSEERPLRKSQDYRPSRGDRVPSGSVVYVVRDVVNDGAASLTCWCEVRDAAPEVEE
jgi:hypothetical protein